MTDLIQSLLDAGRLEQQRSIREAVRLHAAEDLRRRLLKDGREAARHLMEILAEIRCQEPLIL